MFLKLIALAAVGGAAWLFMRPQIPILPPGIIGKKRKSIATESAPKAKAKKTGLTKETETSQGQGQLSSQDAPGQHKPKAPAAAPVAPATPRAASPSKALQKELLYTITTNERIVHELLLSGEGPSPGAEEGQAGSSAAVSARAVQQVAQQAFWDVLAEGLDERPPQWERLLTLLEEARSMLLELIPENAEEGKQLRADVLERLNMGYIRDRMQAGYDAEYLRQIFDFIVYTISCMEAPARRESTQKGYAEVLSGFSQASASTQESAAPGQRIRVSLDASSSPEVPVSFSTRDPWVPVQLNTPGDSPRHYAPSRASAPSPGAVSEAQSEDWVLSMNGAEGRSPQQGGLRAPSPTLGAPLEEEVEVRFGMPSDRSNVTVQLVTSPSRGATPPPHPGSAPGAGWAGQGPPGAPGFGRALAAAARFVMEKLAELRADVAKARLDLLKGILQGSQSGMQYERRRYTKAIGENEPAQVMPKTKLWLQAGFRKVEPSSVREAYGAMRVMVGEALLLLIQKPSAISTLDCPEALLLDLQRLVATQNELQRLSLIGASLLVAQMLLGAKGLPSTPVTAENRRYYGDVKETFGTLLAQPDVRMPHLSAAMAASLAKRVAGGDAPAQPSPEDLQSVERLLHRIFSVDDVIYKKVQEGVLDSLRIALVAKPSNCSSQVKARLSKVGADLIQQDVMDAARTLDKVMGLNVAVCEPFYKGIIWTLWAEKSAPVPTS